MNSNDFERLKDKYNVCIELRVYKQKVERILFTLIKNTFQFEAIQ